MASRNMSADKGLDDSGKWGGGPAGAVGKKHPAGGNGGMRHRIAELETALSILRVIGGVVAHNDDLPRQVRRPLHQACARAARTLNIHEVKAPRRGHPFYNVPRSENELPRWAAVVWYRSEAGCIPLKHMFQEMDMLHDLIEGGPSFLAIDRIEVRLTMPWTQTHTIEQHAKEPGPEERLRALEIVRKKRKRKREARETSSQGEVS